MIYYVIIIIQLLNGYLNSLTISKKNLLLLFILVTSSIFFLAGLRGPIEGDYISYKETFKVSGFGNNSDYNIEPIYFLFNKVVFQLGLPFQVVIIVMAFYSVIPKYIFFYKESLNFGMTSLIYFCTVYFIFDFIQIRQAVTISIFVTSLSYIRDKRYLKYFFSVCFATLIHYSAIILLPGIFLFNRRYNKYLISVILIICTYINLLEITSPLIENILVKFGLPEISSDKLLYYGQSDNFSAVTMKQLILGFLFLFTNKNEKFSESHNLLVNLFLFGIVVATLFNGIPEVSFRMKWYFFWTEAVLVVSIIEAYAKNLILIKIIFYTLMAFFYLNSLFSMLDEFASRGPYIFPYKTFLSF